MKSEKTTNMKRAYKYLLSALCLLAACTDDGDYSARIPENYRKIVYFKDAGWIDLDFSPARNTNIPLRS